ncbi:hypothetical protein IQ219_00240 [Synechocystis sp. LEGE 06083]|jgi:hypothetical protein|uniref:hypothetical protein n=1 Tax=Synechocystis sp. LEGE 06083 TaxID=915336 RepID=UPI00187E3166|nr:hypothetical protein [Synechocystis sp. LEGE 06083]MBE9193789.1 hypothetical protein [Synechocystis sp. LEGE 06083]
MVYVDPVRAQNIKQFLSMVSVQKLQPYYLFIEEDILSVDLALRSYHDYTYKQYFARPKEVRYQEYSTRLLTFLNRRHHAQAGIFIMRTALFEGAVTEPSLSLWNALQPHWSRIITATPESIGYFFAPYLKFLEEYFSLPEEKYSRQFHATISSHLCHVRNQIATYAVLDDGYGHWKERYSLWHKLLTYDQAEADHLAALNYQDFLRTDYWRVVARNCRYNAWYRCQFCGLRDTLDVHHLNYDFRGQEILFPHTITCICRQCHDQAHQ